MSRNKDKSKTIFSSLLPSSQAYLHLDSFTSSSPSSVRGGEWGLWSVHNSSSLLLLPPRAVPYSSLGPLHGLQIFMNCSSLGPSPVLQFLQNKTAAAWGPP